jgi:hypothetical protein
MCQRWESRQVDWVVYNRTECAFRIDGIDALSACFRISTKAECHNQSNGRVLDADAN